MIFLDLSELGLNNAMTWNQFSWFSPSLPSPSPARPTQRLQSHTKGDVQIICCCCFCLFVCLSSVWPHNACNCIWKVSSISSAFVAAFCLFVCFLHRCHNFAYFVCLLFNLHNTCNHLWNVSSIIRTPYCGTENIFSAALFSCLAVSCST